MRRVRLVPKFVTQKAAAAWRARGAAGLGDCASVPRTPCDDDGPTPDRQEQYQRAQAMLALEPRMD